jgi:hypothetical protein
MLFGPNRLPLALFAQPNQYIVTEIFGHGLRQELRIPL